MKHELQANHAHIYIDLSTPEIVSLYAKHPITQETIIEIIGLIGEPS